MGDSSENKFDGQSCEVCGADATPLSADSFAQQFAAHITDYDDPHQTRRFIPKVYYGGASPAVGDGYNPGDWYIDTKNRQMYSYRQVSEYPAEFEWILATPSVSASLANYVYVTPSSTARETNLDRILASYLTTDTAASSYVTQQQFDQLSSMMSGFSSINPADIVVRPVTNPVRNLDDILDSYATKSYVSSCLSNKQSLLVAGDNISIHPETNVIAANIPEIPLATKTSKGLMSPSDKINLGNVLTDCYYKQDKLTNEANAGAYVQIDSEGRISVAIPEASSTQAGLMSVADKTKLASLEKVTPTTYTLPVAAPTVLGGVRVSDVAKITDCTALESGALSYVAPAGWTPCRLGKYADYIYSADAPVASVDTYGTVKVGGVLSSTDTGFVPCSVNLSGQVCYSTAVQTVASGDVLGGIKVDSTVLDDTTGYSKLRVSSDGTAYYLSEFDTAATSETLGSIMVDSTSVPIGGIGNSSLLDSSNWMKIRCDDSGYAYFNHSIASSRSLGHVRVSDSILTDTTGFQMCQVDTAGRIYYAAQALEKASSTVLGGVKVSSNVLTDTTGYRMCQVDEVGNIYSPAPAVATSGVPGSVKVDSTAVDSTAPSPYVKCRVDENGNIYSKGYDDAIAALQYQGAGHDVMHTPALTSCAHGETDVDNGNPGYYVYYDCSLMNNAMNYIAMAGTANYLIHLKFPARLNPSTNARDFFVVIKFPDTWLSTQELVLESNGSLTQGETIVVLGDPEYGCILKGDLADCTTMLYFTEVVSGTFVMTRKTVSPIMSQVAN